METLKEDDGEEEDDVVEAAKEVRDPKLPFSPNQGRTSVRLKTAQLLSALNCGSRS